MNLICSRKRLLPIVLKQQKDNNNNNNIKRGARVLQPSKLVAKEMSIHEQSFDRIQQLLFYMANQAIQTGF